MVTAVRASEAIARILQREGTEFLFCFPAHGVIDACAALGVRPIITRTERTLVNMADGYTRVSDRSEEHTSELQSLRHLVCRLLLEKKKKQPNKPALTADDAVPKRMVKTDIYDVRYA